MEGLSFMDRAILAAFDQWLHANPNGGTFQYHDLKLIVTTKAQTKENNLFNNL